MSTDPKKLLQTGLNQLSLTADDNTQQKLLAYLNLLLKWNRAYNLTAIGDLPAMIIEILLDSLAITPYIHGTTIIDVGSGGGIPGFPLAIYNPAWQITLLDSNGKKTRFLNQARYELGLNNVCVINTRVEHYQPSEKFNNIVTRAFSQLANVLEMTQHLCDDNGQFLLMKGSDVERELQALPAGFSVQATHSLHVPFLDKQRFLVCVNQVLKDPLWEKS